MSGWLESANDLMLGLGVVILMALSFGVLVQLLRNLVSFGFAIWKWAPSIRRRHRQTAKRRLTLLVTCKTCGHQMELPTRGELVISNPEGQP